MHFLSLGARAKKSRRLKTAAIGRHGFTLTEITIVLGIASAVTGAIWSGYSQFTTNNKAHIATQQAQAFLEGYRRLYDTGKMNMANYTDITCLGYMDNLFPSAMIPKGFGCTPSVSGNTGYASSTTPATYITTPWGGKTEMAVKVGSGVANAIEVVYTNMSVQACSLISAAFLGNPNLVAWTYNGSVGTTFAAGIMGSVAVTPTADVAAADCKAATQPITFALQFSVK